MILNYTLSKENRQLIPMSEKICYCVPFDISKDGSFLDDSFVAVTEKKIYVLSKGTLLREINIDDLEYVKSEPGISCGVFFVVPKATGREELLVNFSAKHLARYAYIAKGIEIFISGGKTLVVSEEYEKHCPRCGKALPGTKECPHCSRQNKGVIYEMGQMIKPHMGIFTVILSLMLLTCVISIVNPEIQKRLIDGVLTNPDGTFSMAIVALTLIFTVNLISIFVNVGKSYQCTKLGSLISMDLRAKLYSKIQRLSLAFIDDRKPGDLMNRIISDTRRISDFMGDAFCNLFTVILMLIAVVAYMLYLDWQLALISFIFVPVGALVSFLFKKNIHRRFHMQWVKEDKINSNLRDVISGMTVVKSYGKELEETEHFRETANDYAKTQKKNEVFWAIFFPGLQFLMGMSVYLVTYFGGKTVLIGGKTIGELQQFIMYTSMMYNYVGWLTNLPRTLMNTITSVERISDVMNQEPRIVDAKEAVDHDIEGDIEFKNVTFGYKSYEPVLKNINLKVKKGEMIGLVGASGTGKSTMINLIMHLYDVDDGQLLVDGIDIKNIRLEKFHSQIGVVLQETFLFSGTILNNLRFAKPDATMFEIIQAAKMANAHDFICKTPDGYNTYVGEKGYNLSGGERQRIAIARAILNNPSILILDEATASLDTESEYLIQTAIDRLTAGKTTFAIAHRLSTLKNADRLVVLDGHSIAEVGTHNELMEKKGIYYGLVNAQLEMQKRNDEKEENA